MAEFSTAWKQTLENKGTEEGGIWGRKGKSERERERERMREKVMETKVKYLDVEVQKSLKM